MTILEIEVTVEGPFLTQSSAAGGYGVDAPLARTKRNGKECAYVPGSLLKGKLRQAWEEIGIGDALGLLGEKSGNQENRENSVDAKPAQLYFEDLLLQGEAPKRLRHRIQIERARGSVKEGALLVMESPFASGSQATFRGCVRWVGSGATSAEQVREWLEWGLRWTPGLGAERSIGFGQITGVKVSVKAAAIPKPAPAVTDSFQYSLKPAAPFCVSLQRLSGNLFESDSEIPGGVLKGMVARMLLAMAGDRGFRVDAELGRRLPKYAHLCAEFERVRFTHALPAKSGEGRKRPVRPPLSLVSADERLFFDAADRPKPFLIGGAAPTFKIDWKHKDPDALQQFGREWPETELRVRTAIDGETLRAKESQLFAYEMVNPNGFEWLGTADLSQVTKDKAAVAAELASLLTGGLAGLGKTKAAVEVECGASLFEPALASRPEPISGEWRITLMTAALLCDPAKLTRSSGNSGELLEAYRDSWSEISKRTLRLERFFAAQKLAGGYYLFKRFQKGQQYLPWLLTEPGSVFILRAAEGKLKEASAFVKTAWEGGLDLPDWAKAKYGDSWETCPFVRENGYGEVAVNIAMKDVALPEEGVTLVDEIQEPLAD